MAGAGGDWASIGHETAGESFSVDRESRTVVDGFYVWQIAYGCLALWRYAIF